MKKLFSTLILLIAFTSAHAQYSTRGLSLTPYLNGSSWTIEEEDTESGGGISLEAAYGFSELISAYLHVTGAEINPENGSNYTLGHFDAGAQFNFRGDANKFRPYARAALNGRAAEFDLGDETMETSGAGLTVGGGFRYFFSSPLALNINLDLTVGTLDKVEIGGIEADSDMDATSARFNIGLSWFPGR